MAETKTAKSVLITGGTDGLGKAGAILLAERGYRVFAAGRSAEKRARLDALARERKLALESLEMDVCDDASVRNAVQTVMQKAAARVLLRELAAESAERVAQLPQNRAEESR